ncbi:GMC oxidoreductase [Virgisporangium aliadipatigenens]|uniref:long-chain-alcohol oxidase n=1 Tax=Virgisporangium aliadipatigenens TaxID=741659 RepID=A0A8J4DV83_9ACTN|nr:GMC family oxidoreductase [Virgisporangium aliadipatigenens]GIJ50893.1 GMC oxidoreductase [Virgisporangium aliadipatigenens]
MTVTLTDSQRRTLAALADTFVAAVPPPDGVADPDGFYSRTGSTVGAPAAVEFALGALDPVIATGLIGVVDALAGASPEDVAASSPEAAIAVAYVRALLLGASYTLVDETGANPFWRTIGYPAPGGPGGLPHALHPVPPANGETIRCDAVVIGSGAGGGVIAAELAAAGRSVVVLEAGGYFDGESAVQYEVLAGPMVLYRAGGFTTTADGNVNLWAGATLGGGTTVNWSNCVRTPEHIRAAWGLDGPDFDAHLDAVLARIGANEEASVHNGSHRKMLAGAEKLGWSYRRAALNLDPKLIEYDRAALLTYGDRTGAKQGTTRTFLVDAERAGARICTGSAALRIVTTDGRASGVVVGLLGPDGSVVGQAAVEAPTVVVACGALESAALLLRSGIGGPAVGHHLHLHPSILAAGLYDEPVDPWEGPIQSALVDEFAMSTDEVSGVLIESVACQVGATASTLPWNGAAAHKHRMAKLGHMVSLCAITADRGSGTVTLDAGAQAVHSYPVDDPRDQAGLYRGLAALARLHEAAGAAEIWPLTPAVASPVWRRGDDLAEALTAWQAVPVGIGGHYLGSAHQMGGARMGTDPLTSVARPTGELHDTAGVWIGDTSAFPTALGVNPMVTCMALARRTAAHIVSPPPGP